MTVNLECFVLRNLGMNALILVMAARLAGVRMRRIQILGAAALGCGYAVCAYLPAGRWLLGPGMRTVVCGAMTLVTCMGKCASDWRRTLRTFGFIWLGTMVMGGTGAGLMTLLGSAGYGWGAALMTAAAGSAAMLWLGCRRRERLGSPVRTLTIRMGGRQVRFPAAVDTGNVLVEPLSNLPVIVVERRALCGMECGRRFRRVPFDSVGGEGMLAAYAPDGVQVDGREIEAYIAVCERRLCAEGYGLIPGRCILDEDFQNSVGERTAAAGRRQRTLHRRQPDAARTLYQGRGGADDGGAAPGR